MSVEQALGSIAMASERWPTFDREKLEFIEAEMARIEEEQFEASADEEFEAPRRRERQRDLAFYMLATFAFDTYRRLAYVFKATKPFALFADPELLHEILEHEARLKSSNDRQDYKGLAEELQTIIREQHREIEPDWERLCEIITGRPLRSRPSRKYDDTE